MSQLLPSSIYKIRPRSPEGRFLSTIAESEISKSRVPYQRWLDILESHRQAYIFSGRSSLLELLLKLGSLPAPDLQSTEINAPASLESLIEQGSEEFSIAQFGDSRTLLSLVRRELNEGRPVGLWYSENRDRGWILVALAEVGNHSFVELWSKARELGGGEGRWSEKRCLLFSEVICPQLPTVVHLKGSWNRIDA